MELLEEGKSATATTKQVGLSIQLLSSYGAIVKDGRRWKPTGRIKIDQLMSEYREEMIQSFREEMDERLDILSEQMEGQLASFEDSLKRIFWERTRESLEQQARDAELIAQSYLHLQNGTSVKDVLKKVPGSSTDLLKSIDLIKKRGSKWETTGKLSLTKLSKKSFERLSTTLDKAASSASRVARKRFKEGESKILQPIIPSTRALPGGTPIKPRLGKGLFALIQDSTNSYPSQNIAISQPPLESDHDRERRALLDEIDRLKSQPVQQRTAALPLSHLLQPTLELPPDQHTVDLSEFRGGFLYLLDQRNPGDCYHALEQLTPMGAASVCITRSNPRQLTREYNLSRAKLIWLISHDNHNDDEVSYSLEVLFSRIEEYMDQYTYIMLDGLEYLISMNNFLPVLQFLRKLVDRFSVAENIGLLPVAVKAFEENEIQLLQREMRLIQI